MLNRVIIMGRLTRDPELRYTNSNIPVASFTVAVDRDFADRSTGERPTDFINAVAWRQTGEFVSNYFSKGSMIVVSGRLQIREYTDREGKRRTAAEVVADTVYFGESKRREGEAQGDYRSSYGGTSRPGSYGGGYGGAPAPGGYAPAQPAPGNVFTDIDEDDGELPF